MNPNLEKPFESLAGHVSGKISGILYEWSVETKDPEFKKFLKFLSSLGGKLLWKKKKDNIESYIDDLYDRIEKRHDGSLHVDDKNINIAEKGAANDILDIYISR